MRRLVRSLDGHTGRASCDRAPEHVSAAKSTG